jgi:ABC-type nitrate/sulfonate/bicarbonate transport system ATPase subunit
LGNTGCGKSTLFNWLMGNELIVKKDVNLKAANWIVEAEIENNISKIGHV